MKSIILALLPLMCFAQNKSSEFKRFKKAYDYYSIGYDLWHKPGELKSDVLDSALSYFNKSLSIYPLANSYLERGKIEGIRQKYTAAFDDYTAAIRNCGKDFKLKGSCYYSRAELRNDVRDFKAAIDDCNLSIKYDPSGDALNYSLIGELEYELGDYLNSISYCNKCITKYPGNNYAPYLYRGLSEIKIGQKQDGCKDLQLSGTLPGANDWVNQMVNSNCN